MSEQNNGDIENQDFQVNPAIIGWGIAAFIMAIAFCTFNNSPLVLGASFFTKTCAVLLGTGLGLVGALIGSAIRNFVRPDSFYTTGGFFQILWIKVFWLCGPQTIGLAIGVAIGVVLVLQ